MNKREKLIKLLQEVPTNFMSYRGVGTIADYLLEHGVDIQDDTNDNILQIDNDIWYVHVHLSNVAHSISIIKGRVISIDYPRSLYGCFTVKPYIDVEMPIFKVSDIGTKVFSTREEAQQALKDYLRKL